MRYIINSLVVMIGFVMVAGTIVAQQNTPDKINLPQTDLGNTVKRFISSMNSSSLDSINNFVTEFLSNDLASVGGKVWTKEKYFEMLTALMKDGGLFELVDIKQGFNADYLAAIFSTSLANKPVGIEFVKNKNNNSLLSIEVHPMGNPNKPYEWTKDKLDFTGIALEIEKKVQKDFEAGLFSGNILIAKGDTILLEKSYGYANSDKQILNNSLTRFHTGSVGKMITATAIAQLVEKNKINFTDTLGKILIDYPNKNAADKITVHQLLTHTTGIADPFELGRRKPGVDYSTAQSNLSLFADVPLKMEPGTHHSYSNGNYAVLALIVEKVSGLSFEEYINKNIFVPAGMEIASKQFYKDLPLAVRYSHSAENDPLGIRPLTPVSDPANDIQFEYSGFSNGYMTAKDVYKFLFALKSGMLISKKMLEVITTGKVEVEAGAPIKYAYGFYDANIWGANFRGHSGGGGNSGIGADAEMLWDNDYYIIILGNCDLDKVRPIEFSIIRFLSGQN